MDERILIGGGAAIFIISAFFISPIWSLVFYIGAYRIGTTLYEFGNVIYRAFVQKRLNVLEKYGKDSYVFITGAAQGIGLAYAQEFAKSGFNLILLDINQEGIDKAKKSIQDNHKDIKVESFQVDLSAPNSVEDYQKIIDKFDGLDVSIVVNNAGMMLYEKFNNSSPKKVHDIIEVNASSVLMLCTLFLEKLKQRKSKSAIINMASSFGIYPVTQVAFYSALKAFVRYFSIALGQESGSNVETITVGPHFVSTEMAFGVTNWQTCKPSDTAKNVVNALGTKVGTVSGFWTHDIITFLLETIWYCNHDAYYKVAEFAGKGELIDNLNIAAQKYKKE